MTCREMTLTCYVHVRSYGMNFGHDIHDTSASVSMCHLSTCQAHVIFQKHVMVSCHVIHEQDKLT